MRWRAWIGAIVLAGALAAALTSATISAFSPRPPEFAVPVRLPADAQPVRVIQVLAGDTVIVTVDRPGPYIPVAGQITAKLIGVDAPDFGLIDQCFAQDSEAKLSALLPEDSIAWLKVDVQNTDELGRWLVYVWNSEDNFVNVMLALDGYARALPSPPNVTYYPAIERAAQSAASRFAGLWGECR